MAQLCDCGRPMIEKTRGRGYTVLGCKGGCPCYRTIDETTGQILPTKRIAQAAGSEHLLGTAAILAHGNFAEIAVTSMC